MNNVILDNFTKDQLREEPFKFEIGSTVRVHVKIKEGSRERIQVLKAPSLRRSTAAFPRPLPFAGFLTASVWRERSPSTPPTLQTLRLSAAVKSVVRSFTICVTDPVRLLR